MGSLLCLNSTRNSRRSEIISHFRFGTGPVWVRCGPVLPGAVNSHTQYQIKVPGNHSSWERKFQLPYGPLIVRRPMSDKNSTKLVTKCFLTITDLQNNTLNESVVMFISSGLSLTKRCRYHSQLQSTAPKNRLNHWHPSTRNSKSHGFEIKSNRILN